MIYNKLIAQFTSMPDDPYVYSTYSLVAAIVLYLGKRLRESQCVLRDGTLQIQLSGLQSSFRQQPDTLSQHRNKNSHLKHNANQENAEEAAELENGLDRGASAYINGNDRREYESKQDGVPESQEV